MTVNIQAMVTSNTNTPRAILVQRFHDQFFLIRRLIAKRLSTPCLISWSWSAAGASSSIFLRAFSIVLTVFTTFIFYPLFGAAGSPAMRFK